MEEGTAITESVVCKIAVSGSESITGPGVIVATPTLGMHGEKGGYRYCRFTN